MTIFLRRAGQINSLLILVLFVLASISCAPREAVHAPQKPARIAVVLGAGASRGFAHIGVLKVLELNRVPVHMVVGTSAGSFVGSLYAYGFNAFQLQKIALSLEKGDIADLTVPDNGFIKGEKLEAYINSTVNNTPIEKLRLPFYAVATGIPSGEEVVFGKGNTGTAVRASCSIPGIFRPVKIADKIYIDGGVVSPVAVDAAKRQGADVVIAVDISSDLDTRPPEGTIDTILQAINVMYAKLSTLQTSKAEILIKPKVGYIGSADFEKRHEAILEGEKAAADAMPKIKALIERLRREGRLE
jgi:NTE family protein